LGNVIVLMPPLSMSVGELRLLVDATGRAIREVL
jgi:adenosylmethionine-8-amino-7-oxononanoate aminotransferase